MKKLLFLFIPLGILFACEKPLWDYRVKYIGTYEVTAIHTSWIMGQTSSIDTSYYEVNIRRSEDLYCLIFKSNQGESQRLIEKDGTLHFTSADWHYHESGRFTSKNTFNLSGGYYGLGGGSSFTLVGLKKVS